MKFGFRSHRERFLIVEAIPGGANAFLLSVDANKEIACPRVWQNISLATAARITLFGRKPPTILAVDPTLAAVEFQPFKHVFERSDSPIESHEFENILADALERAMPTKRALASKELGVDELDVVLVQGRALTLSLDKRETHYPPGQSGKILEGTLELLFVARNVFDTLTPFFSDKTKVFLTEIGKSELACLARISPSPLGILIFPKQREQGIAFTYGRTPEALFARSHVDFHPYDAVRDLATLWDISINAAFSIYRTYLAGNTSERVAKNLQKFFMRHRKRLQNACVSNQLRGQIYIHHAYRLPFVLPIRSRATVCDTISVPNIVEQFGFRVVWEKLPITPEHFFRIFAPFIEYHFDKSDAEIGRSLKRRIHWIHPTHLSEKSSV